MRLPRIVEMEIRQRAYDAFCLCEPLDKVRSVMALWSDAPLADCDTARDFVSPLEPGRPEKPDLVGPKDVPKRSAYTPQGHAALVHSIAHIEFNAINLALDAVWRFTNLPQAYYRDWLGVAYEEAQHFSLLEGHLQQCGYRYGDFVAHDGLWTVCADTQHDVLARMALIPRTMEARGLDATPMVQTKLRKVGTQQALQAVEILELILNEEVGHVAIGNHWYHWLCEQNGVDATTFYKDATLRYRAPTPKPPFNIPARLQAGFTPEEIADLPHHHPRL